jgi:hypothetical protein
MPTRGKREVELTSIRRFKPCPRRQFRFRRYQIFVDEGSYRARSEREITGREPSATEEEKIFDVI